MSSSRTFRTLTLGMTLAGLSAIGPFRLADAASITITDNTEGPVAITSSDPMSPPGFLQTVKLVELATATWSGEPLPPQVMRQTFVLTEGEGGPASDIITIRVSPMGFLGVVTLDFRSDDENPAGLGNIPPDAKRIAERTDGNPQTIPFTLLFFPPTIQVINDSEPRQVPEPSAIALVGIGALALLAIGCPRR